MKFLNRWRINGTLTTVRPLRIGDGGEIKASERGSATKYMINGEVDPLINTVALDYKRNPYIPGSAIKGPLRSWAKARGIDGLDIVFGNDKSAGSPDDIIAGKVQFSNAFQLSIENTFSDDVNAKFSRLPSWEATRMTAISAGIAVDRKTRTAADKKLFHQEYVPPGITFRFSLLVNDYEITAADEAGLEKRIEQSSEAEKDAIKSSFQNLKMANKSLLADEGILKVLSLMEGFNAPSNPVCLGAETSGTDESWGRLEWKLESVERVGADEIKDWLEIDHDGPAFVAIDEDTLSKWKVKARASVESLSVPATSYNISLQCSDDFLVNDPSHAKTKVEKDDKTNDKPNHSPLRNKDGMPLLPKSSVKGAVRSQAEKILRTIAASRQFELPDSDIISRIACYPDDTQSACKPIKTADEVKRLCLACQLFGASGWKSPLSFSDFVGRKTIFESGDDGSVPRRREFVAIDRFTGGAAPGAKFNAEVAHTPVLDGKIGFNQSRLGGHWAVGLLALIFRDLIEGDIRIGFGRAKGFGEISATINGKKELTEILGLDRSQLESAVSELIEKVGGK
jgi:CRISPR/Cas system CSM-associated protein Csm3 (group 7 of RAMP superfamily)